jgi:hypothetical protein
MRRSPWGNADLERRWFAGALLLGTWIPMVFFTVVGSFGASEPGVQGARSVLLFLGLGHVPATLLLYVDKGFLPLVGASRTRYIYLPIALIVASGVVFTVGGPILRVYSSLAFIAWQAYHYGRQNIGVYAFAGIAHGWRPEKEERWALQVTTLCGVFGTFKVLGMPAAPTYLSETFELLYRAGLVVFAGVLVLSVGMYVKNRSRFTLSKAAFFFTLLLFFLPLFLSSGIDGTFFSYAIAHGFQYIAFVAVVSASVGMREGRRGISGAMVVVAALIVAIGVVGACSADLKGIDWINGNGLVATAIDFAAGIGMGATMAHFVIDAGAWKLSRPSVRSYVARRFGFLFEGASVSSGDTPTGSGASTEELPAPSGERKGHEV